MLNEHDPASVVCVFDDAPATDAINGLPVLHTDHIAASDITGLVLFSAANRDAMLQQSGCSRDYAALP